MEQFLTGFIFGILTYQWIALSIDLRYANIRLKQIRADFERDKQKYGE